MLLCYSLTGKQAAGEAVHQRQVPARPGGLAGAGVTTIGYRAGLRVEYQEALDHEQLRKHGANGRRAKQRLRSKPTT